MTYLEEFQQAIQSRNIPKITQLWEEYCQGDEPLPEEITAILQLIKSSEIAKHFGSAIETILPLVDLIEDDTQKLVPLSLIVDLQTSNSDLLKNIALHYIEKHFSSTPFFAEKLRLVGLRGGSPSFQGALSHFLLLNHFEKGKCVLHTAGWGVGEIMDVSFLREQLIIEFENLGGRKKELSFKNGFHTLQPLSETHFLAQRFSNPDALEEKAKKDPLLVIKELLTDLGPKTGAEIKDELLDLVIPEKEYAKWWQQARTKLKKDPTIESPSSIKKPFSLRSGHASWEERIENAFYSKHSIPEVLQAAHALLKEFPHLLKEDIAKSRIIEKIQHAMAHNQTEPLHNLEALLFLENPLGVDVDEGQLKQIILNVDDFFSLLQSIQFISLKKKCLSAIASYREDWSDIFLSLLFTIEPSTLRDLILKELHTSEHIKKLEKKLKNLLSHPTKYPNILVWYFQKIAAAEAPLFSEGAEKFLFLEALLTLLSATDFHTELKPYAKKIHTLLTKNRFLIVRNFLKESSQSFAKEFLLLCTKCHGFSDHDKKILRSLVEVVHPTLSTHKKSSKHSVHTIWASKESFQRIQEHLKHIATVELVAVAKEIEEARAHGDLRENAEYKCAQEKRSRLQSEMRRLSEQIKHARILTPQDVIEGEVGVGTKVELLTPKGEKITYSILGPWDAEPENNILSFQSKLAQAMQGRKKDEKFSFKGEEFKILHIHNLLG